MVEAAICYTGDVSSTNPGKYNLEYYLTLAHALVKGLFSFFFLSFLFIKSKPGSSFDFS